jgi:hypothetical protein
LKNILKNFILALCLAILIGSGQLAWADAKAVKLNVPGCNS